MVKRGSRLAVIVIPWRVALASGMKGKNTMNPEMARFNTTLGAIVLIASFFAFQFNTLNVANAGLPNGSIHGLVWSDN